MARCDPPFSSLTAPPMRTAVRILSLAAILGSLAFTTSAFTPAPAEEAAVPPRCSTECLKFSATRSTPCSLNGYGSGVTVNCGWWWERREPIDM